MQGNGVLVEAFSRIPGVVRRTLDGIAPDALTWRVDPDANSIAWLIWHLSRIQDDHVADLADSQQVWVAEEWAPRFDLSPNTTETGHGHTSEQVATVRPDDADVLIGYLDAVTAQTYRFLELVDGEALDRIIDTSWDPPVTMAVRLVSVINDGMQHAGQAALLRGIHDRTQQAG